jgi:outer membrane autotransporter protein
MNTTLTSPLKTCLLASALALGASLLHALDITITSNTTMPRLWPNATQTPYTINLENGATLTLADLSSATDNGAAVRIDAGRFLEIKPSGTNTTGNVLFRDYQIPSNRNGAAIYIYATGTLKLTNATFQLTDAFIPSATASTGGALYQAGGVVELTNVSFINNRASSQYGGGGASFVTNGAGDNSAKLAGMIVFDKNSAMRAGGVNFTGDGEFAENSTAIFTNNSAISNNTNPANGGAMYLANSTLNVRGTFTASDNSALNTNTDNTAAYGGAIFGTGTGNVFFHKKASFIGNSASKTSSSTNTGGGAIYMPANWRELQFKDEALFERNTTNGIGGAISYYNSTIANGSLTFDGPSLFNSNTAGGFGGAIYTVGALNLNNSGTFIDNISGTAGGAIYANTAASVRLVLTTASAGDITFTGNIANNGGAAQYNNAIHFNTNATAAGSLTIDTAAGRTVNFLDPISSNASSSNTAVTVTKTGSGAVVFDTYRSDIKAGTTVNGGTFKLASNATYGAASTIAGSTFTLNNAATLIGSGTINAIATANAGSLITIGDPAATTPGRLAFGGALALNGASITFDLLGADGADPAAHDSITTAGAVTAANLNTIDVTSLKTGTHTYNLLDAGAGNTIGGAINTNYTLTINGATPTARYAGTTLTISGQYLQLDANAVNLVTDWTGADTSNPGLWSDDASQNWSAQSDSNEKSFVAGDSINFGDAAAQKTITIASTGVTIAGMAVSNSAGNDYTFAGSGGISARTDSSAGITPTGKLTKTGAGALTFTNTGTNTFANGIEITQGAIDITHAAQINTTGTAITFLGDATLRASAGIPALSNKLNAGANRTATLDTGANTVTYTGDLSGFAASATLAKTGAGTLTLDGNYAAYAASTRVDNGKFLLAAGSTLAGAVTAASTSAAIGGAGAYTGALNINNGALLVGAGAATDILALTGPLNLTADSTVTFALFNNFGASKLNATGAINGLVANSTIINFDTTALGALVSGTYQLGSGIATLAGGRVAINGAILDISSRQNGILDTTDPSMLKFIYGTDTSRIMTWTGAGDNAWDSDGTPNWTGSDSKNKFLGGDVAIFQGNFANATIDIRNAAAKVSALNIAGTGTLTFTGLGIDGATTLATGAEVTPALATGRLVKTGEGTLILANAHNDFENGIQLGDTGDTGGVLAFSTTAQLGANTIRFANTGTLRALAPVLTISNNLYFAPSISGEIDTAAGNTLTLAGINSGAGTLLKTGAGTLVYSGAGALGHASTEIRQGLVRLDGILTAPVSPLHTFIIDGGWLDLSDTTYTAGGTTANNWGNLTFVNGANAAAGGIIGSNDAITLRAGDTAFNIGHPGTPAKRGVFVIVDAGATGVATLSGASAYIGYTRIDSGALRVTADAQLGDIDANREIILNGGNLNIGDSFTTARNLELRKTGAANVDADKTTTWAGITKNATTPVTFEKDGPGALIITDGNAADALHVKAGAYVAQTLAAIGAGPVAVGSAGIMQIDTAASGSVDNTFTGPGTLAITRGAITLGGANTIGAITATGASTTVRAASTTAFGNATTTLDLTDATAEIAIDNLTAGNLRMAGGAKVAFLPDVSQGYRTATFASVSGTGTFKLHSNLSAGQADHIIITNSSTGSININITNTGPSPAGEQVGVSIPIIITAVAMPVTFQFVDTNGSPVDGVDAGMFRYGLKSAEDGAGATYNLSYTGRFSTMGQTINYMAGALPLTWFSELDTLHKRMGDLHFEAGAKSAPEVWMRAGARQLNIDKRVVGIDFIERQYDITAGIDYGNRTPKRNAHIGAFIGRGETRRDFQTRSDGRGTSLYAGGYATLATPAGWYIDGVLKYNSFDNDFSLAYNTIPLSASYRNYAIGGSVETGRRILPGAGKNWFITPQLQIAATYLSAAAYTTSNKVGVTLASGWSAQGRAGMLLGYTHTARDDSIFQPYVKLSVASQQTTGVALSAAGGKWDPRIDGTRIETGLGFNWLPARNTQLYFDYEYACGEAYAKPYGLNLGVRFIW